MRTRSVPGCTLGSEAEDPSGCSDRGDWREPPGPLVEQREGLGSGREAGVEGEGPRRGAQARVGRPGLHCRWPCQPLAHLRLPAFHPPSGR